MWKQKASELEGFSLLNAIQRSNLAELLLGQGAIDGHERDGVATDFGTAKVEVGDIDAKRAEQRAETADMARLVLIGDIEHGRGELRFHVDVLDLNDARLAIEIG